MTDPFDDLETRPLPPKRRGVERRTARRHPISVAAQIDTPTRRGRFGVTCNVSRTGALLVTPSRFRIGERASLVLKRQGGDESIEGRVVRLEVNPHDEVGLFGYVLAVRFAAPLPRSFVGPAPAG